LVLSWDRVLHPLRTTVPLEVLVSRTTFSSPARSVSSSVVFLVEALAVLVAVLVPLVSLDCLAGVVTRSTAHQRHA
jgi:hypothetical protein